GMTGAKELDDSILTGDILLNLDTEEDDEIDIGCAGGVDITAVKTYKGVSPEKDARGFQLVVKGLNGGHSGMDIIKGLGNSNKFMGRILYHISQKTAVQMACINGGGLRNAIPRESVFEFVLEKSEIATFESAFDEIVTAITDEYSELEENLSITRKEID